jgi:hypothetical protein
MRTQAATYARSVWAKDKLGTSSACCASQSCCCCASAAGLPCSSLRAQSLLPEADAAAAAVAAAACLEAAGAGRADWAAAVGCGLVAR